MDKIKNYLIIVFILIGIGLFFRYQIALDKINDYQTRLNNQISLNDTLKQEAESVYQKLAIEKASSAEVIENLKNSNKALYSVIKKKDEKIISLASTSIKWKNLYLQIVATDSSIIDSLGNIIRIVKFNRDYGFLKISGRTYTPPPTAKLDLQFQPITFDIIVTQRKDGLWNSRVSFSEEYAKYLVVDDINVDVVPLLTDYNAYLLGIGFGYPYGIRGNFGYKYKRHLIIGSLGKEAVGIDYNFLFKRK